MAKGILKVSKTNKGKIFVELDKLNGRLPMSLSYVFLPDTNLNGKPCEYDSNDIGGIIAIRVEGQVVWSKTPAPLPTPVLPMNKPKASLFKDSLSIEDTLLPKDVRKLGVYLTDIDNFALKLQKAARYEWSPQQDEYKFTFYKNDVRANLKFEIKANYGHLKDNFNALCQRQTQQVNRLFPNKHRLLMFEPAGRLILGLGGESVYETNMTLHPIYGIPYLPSSSLKGVLRSWVISQVFGQRANAPYWEADMPLINAEHRAIQSKLFCIIFGCPAESRLVAFEGSRPKLRDKNKKEDYEYKSADKSALGQASQGHITFFDGIPTAAPTIKTDVMNVHYKDWYKENNPSPPTDTQPPNLIHFLTVDNQDPTHPLRFQTYIATAASEKLQDISSDYHLFIKDTPLVSSSLLLDLVKYWLEKALTEHGIGAKTAVGYGYMKKFPTE